MKKIFSNYIFYFLIKVYQILISPFLPSSCLFYPSCSNYALDAIKKHGSFYGTILFFKRLTRCHPFNKEGGFDPVP